MISLRSVSVTEPIAFFQGLTKLVIDGNIAGLDLSGPFPRSMFIEFVRSLAQAAHLRRLCIGCQDGGDEVALSIAAILPALPHLREVAVDGQDCETSDALWELWRVVAEHPSIAANDLPVRDMKRLGLTIEAFQTPPFAGLIARRKPSTDTNRFEYRLAQAKARVRSQDASQSGDSDIFMVRSAASETETENEDAGFLSSKDLPQGHWELEHGRSEIVNPRKRPSGPGEEDDGDGHNTADAGEPSEGDDDS
jgi:hypothetical protein